MNFIKSKMRNRLSIEATNKHIYTRHNLMQLEKRKQVGQKGSLAALQWGEDSVEDEEDRFDLEQHDAWHEAMEPECETFEAARDEHIEKAQAHYKAVQRSASLHRLPDRREVEADDPSLPASASSAALGSNDSSSTQHTEQSTRVGRLIRRPGRLRDGA